MANPCIGTCACPLCSEDGAEVREGTKKALYIVCDNCVSQIRTMSRAGRARIAALIKRTDPEPEPAPKPEPAPPPAPKTPPKPAPKQPAPRPWYMT